MLSDDVPEDPLEESVGGVEAAVSEDFSDAVEATEVVLLLDETEEGFDDVVLEVVGMLGRMMSGVSPKKSFLSSVDSL